MAPHFADAIVITAGSESYSRGFDPMINNLGDPWKRRLNYPRVWHRLYELGVTQKHTTQMEIIFVLSFLTGICLILPRADNYTIIFIILAMMSPAALLGIERGNSDLFVFFIVALSIVMVERFRLFSAAAIIIGFTLKLFPIFGSIALIRSSRTVFLRYASAMFIFVSIYTIITYSDLLMIREGTPAYADLSYGFNILWMKLAEVDIVLGYYAKIISLLILLLSMRFAFVALLRDDFTSETQEKSLFLDAFRTGSAIYLGTFMLGNNFNYRLIFLIFTIPELIFWAKCSSRDIRLIIYCTLTSLFVLMWFILLDKVINIFPYATYTGIAVNGISSWLVFIGLMYLLFWSMPVWVKTHARHYLVSSKNVS